MIKEMNVTPLPTIVENPEALAETASRLIAEAAGEAIADHGRFTIALAGGETPRATYMRLAAPPYGDRMRWEHVWVFFGDERCVPPDHPDSNYRLAHETLLGKVPIPADQIFRLRGELEDTEAAAAEYTRTLAGVFGTRRGELPRFD